MSKERQADDSLQTFSHLEGMERDEENTAPSNLEGPKNATYERALSAFFADQAPTDEQRQQLPSDVDGLSARRQALIDEIVISTDHLEQLRLVKQLRLRYGLSSDIRIINLALTTEDEGLAIEALTLLLRWLEVRGENSAETMRQQIDSWRSTLSRKVDTLLLRSFNPKIQDLAGRCSRLLF